MLALSGSKLWGAVNFAYLTSPTRRKKLLCILSLQPITSDVCCLFCCALPMVLWTAVSWYPSAIPILSSWKYTLKTPSTLLCVLLSIWIQHKKGATRETVEFIYPDPKHIRSAERWLFLPPRSQRLPWNFIIGGSSMGRLAVLSPSSMPLYRGTASAGDAATSARCTRTRVLYLQGEFSRGDLCP